MLLTAAVLAGGSCAKETTTAPTTTPAAATGTATSRVGTDTTIDLAQLCVHTDPGKRPINVHRAVNCPDGTPVSVQGIVIRGADGSTRLCDEVSAGPHTTCLGDVLIIRGNGQSPGGFVGYTGTISNGVLTIDQGPPFPEIMPPLVNAVPTT
jgi:hypothetical protein